MTFEQLDITHNFKGFGGCESRCHFRILDEANKPLVVICSQTNKLIGTSITNMAEFLAIDVQKYLEQGNPTLQEEIKKYIKTSKIEKLLVDLIHYLKENEKVHIFILESLRSFFEFRTKYSERKEKIKNMVWVQLYPKNVVSSFFDRDRYSIVRFNEKTWEPSWEGTTLEKLVEQTGYSIEKFRIDSKVYKIE